MGLALGANAETPARRAGRGRRQGIGGFLGIARFLTPLHQENIALHSLVFRPDSHSKGR